MTTPTNTTLKMTLITPPRSLKTIYPPTTHAAITAMFPPTRFISVDMTFPPLYTQKMKTSLYVPHTFTVYSHWPFRGQIVSIYRG